MWRVSLCLTVPFVLACGLVGPGEPTIQFQGTVTAADDGSPIPDAGVGVFLGWSVETPPDRPSASVKTDASGRYSLSLETEGVGCRESSLNISVTAGGFQNLLLWFGTSDLRCADEVQTLDFQLERQTN